MGSTEDMAVPLIQMPQTALSLDISIYERIKPLLPKYVCLVFVICSPKHLDISYPTSWGRKGINKNYIV